MTVNDCVNQVNNIDAMQMAFYINALKSRIGYDFERVSVIELGSDEDVCEIEYNYEEAHSFVYEVARKV